MHENSIEWAIAAARIRQPSVRRALRRLAPPVLGMFSPQWPDRMPGPFGFSDA